MNRMRKYGIRLASFSTIEIVLMAMLATANAVLTIYISPVNQMLKGIGGPIATSTITGLYMIYGLLAYYIIRKPGTAVITYGIGAVIQALMGSAYGIASCFVAAACYMIVAEVGFGIVRYKKWSTVVLLSIGGAMVPLWFVFAAYMFKYTAWNIDVLLIALGIRILSGIILCGWLTKLIGDSLLKTGLVRRFAVSRDIAKEEAR